MAKNHASSAYDRSLKRKRRRRTANPTMTALSGSTSNAHTGLSAAPRNDHSASAQQAAARVGNNQERWRSGAAGLDGTGGSVAAPPASARGGARAAPDRQPGDQVTSSSVSGLPSLPQQRTSNER